MRSIALAAATIFVLLSAAQAQTRSSPGARDSDPTPCFGRMTHDMRLCDRRQMLEHRAALLRRHPNFRVLYSLAVSTEIARNNGIVPRGGVDLTEWQFALELASRHTAESELAVAKPDTLLSNPQQVRLDLRGYGGRWSELR